jgi:hypothetical protein
MNANTPDAVLVERWNGLNGEIESHKGANHQDHGDNQDGRRKQPVAFIPGRHEQGGEGGTIQTQEGTAHEPHPTMERSWACLRG